MRNRETAPADHAVRMSDGDAPADDATPVVTHEMEALERGNLLLALEQAKWKISGEKGAAALLGLKPSTLNSRMRALGIERPGSS